jgi:hypothetical protein
MEGLMEIYDFIVTVFVAVDDFVQRFFSGRSLRKRGPLPRLSDSEVITIEIVGEYLGFDTDKGIYQYFKRHWYNCFPRLTDRTNFSRQSANLWRVKKGFLDYLAQNHDKFIQILDSMPLEVCKFPRARHSRLFRGKANYGKWCGMTFFGFRLHLKITSYGLIECFILTPANIHDIQLVEALTDEDEASWILGDKGYRSEGLFQKLWNQKKLFLHTSFRRNDAKPSRLPKQTVKKLTGMRRLIETVVGQLEQQFSIKKIWARDLWHLTNRISRKILAHTFCVTLNLQLGRKPLHLKGIVA